MQNRPFIQIHKLYESNWVVIIDFFHICEIDSDEARSTIYIYDSFLKKSYRKKTNEVRYPLTFIQDARDLMSRPYKMVEFVVVDVSQASGVELSGFYSRVFAYHILNGVGMQKLHINEEKIFDVTCVFLERGTFPEDTFNFNNRERKQVFTRFQEELFRHCFQPNIGRMKQCDRCQNWFHEDCEDFSNENQTETVDEKRFWFCRYCIGIHRLPGEILVDIIFANLCLEKEEMHTVLAQVCKRWSEHNNQSFVERVHLTWLRNEFKAEKWPEDVKRRYYVPFEIAKCFACDSRYKVETGYNRGPRDIVAINLEMDESLPPYCNSFEPIYNKKGWGMIRSFR